MKQPLRVALASLALLAVGAPAADAHAVLDSSTPGRGETVDAPPAGVTLRFSEPVEASFGAVRAFDAKGERVDDGKLRRPGGRGAEIGVGLKRGLPDGTYVATYRVISADGHPVSGGLVFSVGRAGAAPSATVAELLGDTEASVVTRTAAGATRALTYAATALVLGGLVFLLVVWIPGLRAASAASRAWRDSAKAFAAATRRVLLAGAVLGAAAGACGIVMQGALAGGTSAWAALSPDVIADVMGTRFGWTWGARTLVFVAVGGLVLLAPRAAAAPVLRPATLGAAGAALPGVPLGLKAALVAALPLAVVPALSGHASVSSPVAVLFGLDILHVAAMSLWLGGLAWLLLALPLATRGLPEPGDRSRLLSVVLARFSPLALACVVTLLATGTAQSVLHIDRWGALLDTSFGRAVLIKVALITALIGLGAINRRRTIPALRRVATGGTAPGPAGRLLRKTLRTEVILAVVVLAVSAALVGYPPPESLAGGPYAGTVQAGPLRMEATVDPARAGPNEVHLYLLNASDGTPFTATKELDVTVAQPDRDIAPIAATARPAGPGHFIVDALALIPAGDWQLHVNARVSDFDAYDLRLEVPVR